MGFFSQDCDGCGHPALSHYVTTDVNDWMEDIVAIAPSGSVLRGKYDGYGRLHDGNSEYDSAVGFDNTIWHAACWAAAGSPVGYRGASRHSADQGFFFADGAHDMAAPAVNQ